MMNVKPVVQVSLLVGTLIGVSVGTASAQAHVAVMPDEAQSRFAIESVTGTSRIGVSVRDVDDADVEREGLSTATGALVGSVRDDSPADEAGVRAGDIVIEFDGERIRSARQLTRVVRETPPGRTVSIAVMREGDRQAFHITPETNMPRIAGGFSVEGLRELGRDLGRNLEGFVWPGVGRARQPERLGIGVQTLSPQLADYFGVDEGVLVTSVREESPAAAAGLRAGDVITSIDDWTIADVGDLQRRVVRLDEGEEFAIAIVRDREEHTVQTTIEAREERGWRRASPRPI